MSWIVFAVAAPAILALTNLIESGLLEKRIPDPTAFVIITGLFKIVPVLFLVVWGAGLWPGAGLAAFAALTGVVGILIYVPYFQGLHRAAAADVLLMWQLWPILAILAARLLLHETLHPVQYLAIALLLVCSALGSQGGERRRGPGSARAWMLLASVLQAAEVLMQRWLFLRTSFTTGYAWMAAFSFLTALVLLAARPVSRKVVREAFRGKSLKILVVNQALDVAGITSSEYATSLVPASLISATEGLQPLFVLLFGALAPFRKFSPQPPSGRAHQIRRAVAIVCAVAGLALIGI